MYSGRASIEAHSKLGWLDNVELTEADRNRIRDLSGQSFSNSFEVIRSRQSGARGSVTRRDFELLYQDRRRAHAAYPEVSDDDLNQGIWLQVDLDAHVTQVPPATGVQTLADRVLPVKPDPEPNRSIPYYPGMTLMPGQSMRIGGP